MFHNKQHLRTVNKSLHKLTELNYIFSLIGIAKYIYKSCVRNAVGKKKVFENNKRFQDVFLENIFKDPGSIKESPEANFCPEPPKEVRD